MAIYKPGRLHRTLSFLTGSLPLFTVNAGEFSVTDDDIYSIVISRGSSSGRNVGHNPSVCEVRLTGRRDGFLTGGLLRVVMPSGVAGLLAGYLGNSTGEAIATRFKGRLSTIGIDDTGKSFSTDIAGSSYLTQMNYSPASFTPHAGEALSTLIYDMTKANEPIRGVGLGINLGMVKMVHHAEGEPTLYKEGIGKFAADIGLMFQELRDGTTRVWSHVTRADSAESRLGFQWPLMRNQAIAPGRYEQSNEQPPKRVEFTIINESGNPAVRTAEISNPTGGLVETETVDWSAWRVLALDNQLNWEAYARVYESSSLLYTIPTIRVDLLMLIKLGTEYSKKIAAQILMLEVGEPVFLSGDWPARLQGIHFADGIKETIGPDEWTVDLSLIPHAAATGSTSPPVPAKAWDSAINQWNEETREWNKV